LCSCYGWQNKLIKSYDIAGFPHYALIGKDGKIISNDPKRRSEGLTEDLENFFNKATSK
jgi:hypothetical protein